MNDDDYGIVVGIDDYNAARTGLIRLQGAKNDAQQFYDWLVSEEGGAVPEHNVWYLPSHSTCEVPTMMEVAKAFIELRSKSPYADSRIGRRLYVFMAGHGVGPQLDEAGLLTTDTTPVAPFFLAGKLFVDHFRASALFKEVVLLMDCCRDYDSTLPDPWCPFGKVVDAADAANVSYFYVYATGFGRKSREQDFNGKVSGVFTQALMRGLSGAAAGEDGTITTTNLVSYLKGAELRGELRDQEPQFQTGREVKFREGLQQRRVRVHVELKVPADRLVILSGSTMAPLSDLDPVSVEPGVFEVQLLPNRTYLFAIRTNGEHTTYEKATPALITHDDQRIKL